MSEEVILLFIQKNSVLLASFASENRMVQYFIPRETIGEKEKKLHKHYAEHVMHSYIYKVFHGTVMPLQFELVHVASSSAGLTPFVFFIFSWDGELPNFLIETEKAKAKLQWISVDKAQTLSLNPEDASVISLAKESIRIKHLLRRRTI